MKPITREELAELMRMVRRVERSLIWSAGDVVQLTKACRRLLFTIDMLMTEEEKAAPLGQTSWLDTDEGSL